MPTNNGGNQSRGDIKDFNLKKLIINFILFMQVNEKVSLKLCSMDINLSIIDTNYFEVFHYPCTTLTLICLRVLYSAPFDS